MEAAVAGQGENTGDQLDEEDEIFENSPQIIVDDEENNDNDELENSIRWWDRRSLQERSRQDRARKRRKRLSGNVGSCGDCIGKKRKQWRDDDEDDIQPRSSSVRGH